MNHRVLLASPVKQQERILFEFLESLLHLETSQVTLDFILMDDHNDHTLLSHFALQRPNVRILPGDTKEDYLRDESTHYWREDLIWKVARYKDYFIKIALEEGYDYLFLVDSDLYLNPKTLTHLLSLKKDIVSEVFWTRWKPELIPLPQVWMEDQYSLYKSRRGEPLSDKEISQKNLEFLQMLSRPGTYKVGGLGACTLISRRALERGVSFQEIYNLGLTGEDRHFCIRAAALGLELYADTHYPPFHIYRESELDKLTDYKKGLTYTKTSDAGKTQVHDNLCALQTVIPGKITLAMLVRNESGRHLKRVLKQTTEYIDHAIILDDASEDNSVELCQEILQGIPLTLLSNKEPLFHNEILLRRQLWEMAVRTNPEWIIILDADELFEEDAPKQLRELLSHSTKVDYLSFRLFDLWTETQYRDDPLWQAHRWYRPFIVRNIPNFQAQWQETPQHCGRFPKNIINLRGGTSPLRIKHLGWVRPQDRLAKYYRYQTLDPNGTYGNLEQYRSILDPSPNLIVWEK
ncbi:glycosyltransferase [Desulfosporosinus sp. BICA1-9]|uniref:glycosyltransferase n=1 Tax=Desulfosporosinus sp. BICA1-9 TaxID=1531958 RepID=UPI00054C4CEE|nr:glycosyltransferase [Desulfosporosinus sp. BICA1-9]KJS47431.1 MAG: glycosyl transferase [Peptococcaceae bacterium BRH_c23]KJS90324.1 MAG: glycosyl transferase [Desulfosporosinus sp. BICA1-9]HBW38562.1 glycosyl transferase [Desulfosporosinus sp.]